MLFFNHLLCQKQQNIKTMSNNVICWFEIYVKDLNRAKKFYSDVLGKSFQDITPPGDSAPDMKMAFFVTEDPSDPYSVSGALIEMAGTKEGDGKSINTIVYFPCMDCSIEESKVEKAGGIVTAPKMSIGEHGFCSICVDSEGNAFGLYSMS